MRVVGSLRLVVLAESQGRPEGAKTEPTVPLDPGEFCVLGGSCGIQSAREAGPVKSLPDLVGSLKRATPALQPSPGRYGPPDLQGVCRFFPQRPGRLGNGCGLFLIKDTSE